MVGFSAPLVQSGQNPIITAGDLIPLIPTSNRQQSPAITTDLTFSLVNSLVKLQVNSLVQHSGNQLIHPILLPQSHFIATATQKSPTN
jgi:hypothetical protein